MFGVYTWGHYALVKAKIIKQWIKIRCFDCQSKSDLCDNGTQPKTILPKQEVACSQCGIFIQSSSPKASEELCMECFFANEASANKEQTEEVSDIKFTCPHCDQHLEVPSEMFGGSIDCPSCTVSIQLPNPARSLFL